MLPMIDLNFSKENALPYDLWGLYLSRLEADPCGRRDGFPAGAREAGRQQPAQAHLFLGVTPDLYMPMYSAKVVAFFDKLLDQQFADKPFMRHYLDYYFDIYWDLHLGVKGDAIPPRGPRRSARPSTPSSPIAIRCCRSSTKTI